MKKYDLEERLLSFSVLIIRITQEMNTCKAGNHLGKQLLRSGTSVSLNYGEAQSGESRKDFIHKIKVILKELRESFICLKLILRCELILEDQSVRIAMEENNQLIAIFVKSIQTAQSNISKR